MDIFIAGLGGEFSLWDTTVAITPFLHLPVQCEEDS